MQTREEREAAREERSQYIEQVMSLQTSEALMKAELAALRDSIGNAPSGMMPLTLEVAEPLKGKMSWKEKMKVVAESKMKELKKPKESAYLMQPQQPPQPPPPPPLSPP